MLNVFIFLAVAFFLVWFIQSQKLFDYIFVASFLKEIRKCGICLGTWVCLVIYPIFEKVEFTYASILTWIVLSALASTLIFLAREGYRARYGITVIE